MLKGIYITASVMQSFESIYVYLAFQTVVFAEKHFND